MLTWNILLCSIFINELTAHICKFIMIIMNILLGHSDHNFGNTLFECSPFPSHVLRFKKWEVHLKTPLVMISTEENILYIPDPR